MTTVETMDKILRLIKEKEPQNMFELAVLLQSYFQITEACALEMSLKLQEQGKIVFKKQGVEAFNSKKFFFLVPLWYWVSISIALLTLFAVFLFPENLSILNYFRNGLGIIFVLFLPGFTLLSILFPINLPTPSTKGLSVLERTALSLILSLCLLPIVGLFLNYVPWGISAGALVLSLFTLTIGFATIALFQQQKFRS